MTSRQTNSNTFATEHQGGAGCSGIFLVYLFLGRAIAGLSYGRFIAVPYKFKLSMCIEKSLVIGRRGCVLRDLNGKTVSSR
jgi:hypothetical protein